MNHPLFDLLQKLDTAKIAYSLGRYRPDTVLVTLTVPGERIEIDVFDDGHMEVSKFLGDESVESGVDVVLRAIEANSQ